MTMPATRARYTLEFKLEAVRLFKCGQEHRGGGPCAAEHWGRV